MTSKEEILQILKDKKPYYCDKYGISEFMLFGSILNDSFGSASDIDVAVRIPKGKKTYDNYLSLKDDLSFDLQRKIDLVLFEPKYINPVFLFAIQKDNLIV